MDDKHAAPAADQHLQPQDPSEEARGGRVSATGSGAGATQAGPLTGIRDCGRYGRLVQFGDSSYVWEKRAPVRRAHVGLDTACIVYVVWLIWVACTMGGPR